MGFLRKILKVEKNNSNKVHVKQFELRLGRNKSFWARNGPG